MTHFSLKSGHVMTDKVYMGHDDYRPISFSDSERAYFWLRARYPELESAIAYETDEDVERAETAAEDIEPLLSAYLGNPTITMGDVIDTVTEYLYR